MARWLHPVVKNMVLCEDVLPGPPGTGNVHLMNVFANIRPRSSFPYRHSQLCVFLQLTDAAGEGLGHVVARLADSGRVVFYSEDFLIQFRDRLQTKWTVFRLQDCPFPEPGLYLIEFYYHEQWVADQPVYVLR